MTEAEWLAANDSERMIRHVQRWFPSERKCRRFAVLCCRRVWDRLGDDRCRTALVICERYIEGLAGRSELENAEATASAVFIEFDDRDGWETAASAVHAACSADDVTVMTGQAARESALLVPRDQRRVERRWQCSVLRDIFGNPFRPVAFSPSWRTDTAVSLARQMYDARDFSAMPILADALQDAGCDNPDILDHCRQPGEHVRGCWVVDQVLGRE